MESLGGQLHACPSARITSLCHHTFFFKTWTWGTEFIAGVYKASASPPPPIEPSHRTLNIFKNILVFTFAFANGLWISQVRSRAWLSPETLLCFWPEEKQACISDAHFEHAIRQWQCLWSHEDCCWLCFNHPQWECLLLLPPGLSTQLLDDLSALWIGITNSLTSPDVTGAVTWCPGLRGQQGVPFAGSQACRPVRCMCGHVLRPGFGVSVPVGRSLLLLGNQPEFHGCSY